MLICLKLFYPMNSVGDIIYAAAVLMLSLPVLNACFILLVCLVWWCRTEIRIFSKRFVKLSAKPSNGKATVGACTARQMWMANCSLAMASGLGCHERKGSASNKAKSGQRETDLTFLFAKGWADAITITFKVWLLFRWRQHQYIDMLWLPNNSEAYPSEGNCSSWGHARTRGRASLQTHRLSLDGNENWLELGHAPPSSSCKFY